MQVESLTAARQSAMSGSEPSDAIRVVNALLTQLDQVKRYPNVLILTISNVTGAIDLAFVDLSTHITLIYSGEVLQPENSPVILESVSNFCLTFQWRSPHITLTLRKGGEIWMWT